jgi:hypothetical protein
VDASAEAESADRSAWIQLDLRLRSGTEQIRAASFRAGGPPALMAAGSVLTQVLPELRLREARHLRAEHLDELLDGIPAPRRHLLGLAVKALSKAIEQARRQRSRCLARRHGKTRLPAVPLPELCPLREAGGIR